MKELREIQSKLKANKGQYNSFDGYSYRSCEDILEAVKPLLNDLGCTLTISDDIVEVGGRIYVKATASLENKDNNVVSVNAFAREPESRKGMDDSQITGASSSYARKYALNGLFAIDDAKDPDATNTHGKEEPKQQSSVLASDAQLNLIRRLTLKEDNMPEVLAKFGESQLPTITNSKASEIINYLKGE